MNQRTDQPQSSPTTEDLLDEGNERSAGAAFPVVGIGASAGGLEAFTQLLKALPVDTGMAFVLVQHLAPSHPSALAEILSRATSMPVTEVHDEQPVEPNHVYVIPPARCMTIVHGVLQLVPREAQGQGLRRVIDHFFRALAEDSKDRAIGVVLSGTATDGTIGLEAIKADGGITFAQDASAQHDGMPTSAIDSGCVDFVLPPDAIARELVRIGQHPYTAPVRESAESDDGPNLAQVVRALHRSSGVDFTHYKFNTFYRRVTRRMVLHKLDKLAAYVDLLRRDPAEADALYQDILISVTSFFRNPETYDALCSQVFPRLLKNHSPNEPLRFWSLGCSSGQEAYSLAMAFTEFSEAAGNTVPLQLFGTDLNAAAIEKARVGVYPKDIAQDVSPERLRRFFTEVDGGYRIAKSIRDVCVFSRHNALTDPPFSRIDLLSCRNLLIYLAPVLQQKIMSMFHYALKPSGFLWLGSSETTGSHRNLFETQDAKHKIYAKKGASNLRPGYFPLQHDAARSPAGTAFAAQPMRAAADDLPKEADRILSTRFAPPGVLVSTDLEILQYRGDTGAYLAPASGKASLNLLKMLREGLLVSVRAAILRAGNEHTPVREEGLRIKSNGGYRDVTIEVIPLNKAYGGKQSGFLILFEDADAPAQAPVASTPRAAATAPAASDAARLEQELAATREYLQSVIEQQEAANEELQSANEEVQSANEELQSTNEELETSKEEIQSSNEELATVNDELNNRNAELNRLNNDLANLLGSVQMPIVILGPNLRVRRFTPAAEKLLNLASSDVGRALTDIKLNLDDLPDLGPLLADVIDTAHAQEHAVRDACGHQYSLRLRPYHTLDGKIDGVVVMLVDVDAIKRAHALADSILATAREPLVVLDKDLRVVNASRAFYTTFEVTPKVTETRPLNELGGGQWNIPALRRLLEDVLPRDNQIDDFIVKFEFDGIGQRTMKLNARRLLQADDQPPLILLAIEDVTQSEIVERALRESEQRFRVLFELGPVAIFSCDRDGVVQNYNRRAAELWGREPKCGDPNERYCGSLKLFLPDGSRLPHTKSPIIQVLRTGIPVSDVEVAIEHPDGSRIPVVVSFAPLKNEHGEVTGAITAFYDITERKRAEESLRKYAAELSEGDRRKNEFLAMLSHELRNPLAPIGNAVRIMQLADGDAQAVRPALQVLGRQVDLMTRLVEDLLDAGRITRGNIELRLERVELRSILTHAMEDFRAAHASVDHELTVAVPSRPVQVNADASRLTQVVTNLLSNALKFTDSGGRIALSLEKTGKQAVIRVRDNGIGIAADELGRIFELFVQIDTSRARSAGGLGIGLALAKNLVEMHQGTLEVHSDGLGRGSEFIVHLPTVAASVKSPQPEPPVCAPPPVTGRRILIVDDNRDSAESMATLLELTGNQTRTAHDGLAAVKLAAAFRPDVVLMDIGLPKLNGYEAARQIRSKPWGKNVVLVATTGWGQAEDRQKSKDAGFDDHMVKPVDYAALTKLLASLPPQR